MLKLTEEELKELGFRLIGGLYYKYVWGGTILYNPDQLWWSIEKCEEADIAVYPQTKEDLQTLIRLFTPPQE